MEILKEIPGSGFPVPGNEPRKKVSGPIDFNAEEKEPHFYHGSEIRYQILKPQFYPHEKHIEGCTREESLRYNFGESQKKT